MPDAHALPHRVRHNALPRKVTKRAHGAPRGRGSASAVGGEGPPEPSLAERAKTLAVGVESGVLSTVSKKLEGYPFGSVMPYSMDAAGRPVILISAMAVHAQNLAGDPRSSLLIQAPPSAEGEGLGAARLTLLGKSLKLSQVEARDARPGYLAAHPDARYWVDYADFGFFRLEVEAAYYVGGFGVMGWVEAAEYLAAGPDPLASESSVLLSWANTEFGAELKAVVARSSGLEAEEARMTRVDRLGFNVRVRAGGRVRGARVAFPREVRCADEARNAFLELVEKKS